MYYPAVYLAGSERVKQRSPYSRYWMIERESYDPDRTSKYGASEGTFYQKSFSTHAPKRTAFNTASFVISPSTRSMSDRNLGTLENF